MRESKGSACRVGRESGHLFKVGWPDAAIPQGGGYRKSRGRCGGDYKLALKSKVLLFLGSVAERLNALVLKTRTYRN